MKKVLRMIASLVISALILYVLLTQLNTGEILGVLSSLNPLIIIFVYAVYVSNYVFRGLRWQLILKDKKESVKLILLIKHVIIAQSINALVPAKLGELYRVEKMKSMVGYKRTKALGIIANERFLDFVIMVSILFIATIIVFKHQFPRFILYPLMLGFAICFMGIIGLFVLKNLQNHILRFIPKRFHSYVKLFTQGTHLSKKGLMKVSLASTMIWLIDIATLYLIFNVIFSFALSPFYVAFITLSSGLLTLIPVTLSGLGVIEVSMIYLLELMQIEKTLAAAAMVLVRLVNYWTIVFIGLIYQLYHFAKSLKTFK